MTNGLTGKKVVVVGGSSGIGLGVAKAVAARGAEVVIVGRDAGRLAVAAGEIERGEARDAEAPTRAGGAPRGGAAPREPADVPSAIAGRRVRTLVADVTDEASIERVFAAAGGFDHLVVTAADLRYGPIATMAAETARAVIDAKLLAAILLAKHAVASIRPTGSLLFVSGVASARPAPRGSLVAAVNGALDAFVRALAVELAPLRVNTLSPGWVDTPVWDRIASEVAGAPKETLFARFAERLPARRVGTPAELGHAAAFLLENTFTTGATLYVDGGHRLA